MKSTFRVLFFLKRDKAKENGKMPFKALNAQKLLHPNLAKTVFAVLISVHRLPISNRFPYFHFQKHFFF